MGNDELQVLDLQSAVKRLHEENQVLKEDNEKLLRLVKYYRNLNRTSSPKPDLHKAIDEGYGPKTVEEYIDDWT